MRYTWDEPKREWTLRYRGLDFADAYLVYENPNKLTAQSPRHGEERKLDLAMAEVHGVLLALVYLELGEDEVRVISFRRASRTERRKYAKANQQD